MKLIFKITLNYACICKPLSQHRINQSRRARVECRDQSTADLSKGQNGKQRSESGKQKTTSAENIFISAEMNQQLKCNESKEQRERRKTVKTKQKNKNEKQSKEKKSIANGSKSCSVRQRGKEIGQSFSPCTKMTYAKKSLVVFSSYV